jgi:hypothetical protein
MWNGHSCPLPLTYAVILRKRSRSRKRAAPDEEPALSLPKGPLQLLLTLTWKATA